MEVESYVFLARVYLLNDKEIPQPVEDRLDHEHDVRLSLAGESRSAKGTPRTTRGGGIDQASYFIRS